MRCRNQIRHLFSARRAQTGLLFSGVIFIVHLVQYTEYRSKIVKALRKRRTDMKGYNTENGYMGYVNGQYQLFASEADYREWMEDEI